jgi:uncharacterized protein
VPSKEKPDPPRIVLDANIWVSAFITPHGTTAALARAVLRRRLPGIASRYIVDEIGASLSKKRMRKYGFSAPEILDYLLRIAASTTMVIPTRVKVFVRDPDDLPILGTALAGKADYLVTGDRDLVEDQKLKTWMRQRGVKIVSPAEFKP